MGEIRLSIIVPVYNVAPYLKICLDSILTDIKSNTEVIVVDDGSTDGSSLICDNYTKNYPQIRVLHQRNAGQSAARNAGLNVANGTYISFIDSDDFIDSRILNYMVESLDNSDADFIVSTYRSIAYNEKKVERIDKFDSQLQLLSAEDFLKGIRNYAMVVWNKIYRKDFIDGIKFKEGILYEDISFMHSIAMRMKKAIFVSAPMYYYRVARPGSTICTFKMTRIPAYKDMEAFLNDVNANFSRDAFFSISMVGAKFFQQQYIECKLILNDKLILADILKRYKKIVRVLPIASLPFYMFAFRLSPYLYCWIKIKK